MVIKRVEMIVTDCEGIESLGARHCKINARVNTILQQNVPIDQIVLLPGDTDIDKLIKIDVIAKSSENLPLIEKILCCDDMLLVSRAINKCRWLANDPRITPDYLDTNLFPHMSSKAISKLLLSIRKNVKDEQISDKFYLYFMSKNQVDKAMHWLPMCSAQVIKDVMADMLTAKNPCFPVEIFKRIARKMPFMLKNLVDMYKGSYLEGYLENASFLLRTNTNEFLNAVEKHYHIKFNRKATRFLLLNYAERIINNKHVYVKMLHLPTLAKYIGKENILKFLVDLTNDEETVDWFNSTNLYPFVSEMPQNVKKKFIKSLFCEDTYELCLKSLFCEYDDDDCVECSSWSIAEDVRKVVDLCPIHERNKQLGYDWYILAPFPMALTLSLKRCQGNSEDRLQTLRVLIKCCNNDLKNICDLLDHFTESHINEEYGLRFLEDLISNTYTHNYDDNTWAKLELIFHKFEIYGDDEDGIYSKHIAQAIVAYNVLNDKTIPEVIAERYDRHRIGQIHAKAEHFSVEQKQKLFSYYYNAMCNEGKHSNEDEMFIQTIKILNLWDKDLTDFPLILSEMRERINRNDKSIGTIRNIYRVNKRWRRILFRESFFISVEEDVCLNILKHDPNLIINNGQMQYISRKDHLNVDKFLQKVKVYFNDLIDLFLTVYKNSLTTSCKEHSGYQAVIRGFCILLDRDQFCMFLKTYIPSESQINWQKADMSVNCIQKYLAGQMYLVRPTIDVANIMKFTEGDFLQYAVPTLQSFAGNMPQIATKEFVMKCLEGKISIRKLGIRVATSKLNFDEIGQVLTKVWQTNRNYSIRAVLFEILFNLLQSESNNALQNDDRINVLWQTMKKYIENLASDEDKKIYYLLAAVNSMPEKIQPEFCKISYEFLKKLPKKLNCHSLYHAVFRMVQYHIENIDCEWLEVVLLSYMKDVTSKTCNFSQVSLFEDVSVSYILCSQTEEIQIEKYNKFLKPHVDNLLDTLEEATGYGEYRYDLLLGCIVSKAFYKINKTNYANPLKLLETLKAEIEDKYPIYESYAYVCYLKLAISFFGSCQSVSGEVKVTIPEFGRVRFPQPVKDEFIRRSLEIFHYDTSVYCPSLYKDFTGLLKRLASNVGFYTSSIANNLIMEENNLCNNLAAMNLQDSNDLRDGAGKHYANHKSLEVKLNYFRMMDRENFFETFWKREDDWYVDNGLTRDNMRVEHPDDHRMVEPSRYRRRRRQRNCRRRRRRISS